MAKAVRLRGTANELWRKELCLVRRRAPGVRYAAFCDSGAFCDAGRDVYIALVVNRTDVFGQLAIGRSPNRMNPASRVQIVLYFSF